jgi:hypothetical protein
MPVQPAACGLCVAYEHGVQPPSTPSKSGADEAAGAQSSVRWFSGVFDGHGQYGKEVSHFVKDRLPKKLNRVRSRSIDVPTHAHTYTLRTHARAHSHDAHTPSTRMPMSASALALRIAHT